MSFQVCAAIGDRGMQDVLQFVQARCEDGRYVVTNKGPLAPFLQQTVGDVLFNSNGRIWGCEVKTEEENLHKNFFLETHSNRCFGRQKPGWMYTLITDLLLYYFLDTGELYVIPFDKLWWWAWGGNGGKGNIYFYPENEHRKRADGQLNITVGRCVPIERLRREISIKKWVRQDGQFVAEDEPKKERQRLLWM